MSQQKQHNTMAEKKYDTLTKAEMQVMTILWEMPHGGCIHEIIARYPQPKPAYTTVSTFLKILYNKGKIRVTFHTHANHLLIGMGKKSKLSQSDTHLAESDFKYGCRQLLFTT